MSFLIHVIGDSIVCIPISVLKTSVAIGSGLKLGLTVYAQHFVTYKYVFDTYICTFAGCGWYVCNAGCICSRHQCCLNLPWKGLGITLMTLSGWFDLVLGSDVTL